MSRFLRDLVGQGRLGQYIQSATEKNFQQTIFYPATLSFTHEGKIKSFPNKQKLRVHHH